MSPYIYSRIILDQAVNIAALRPPKNENARSVELSKILENLRVARSAVHICLVLIKSRGFPTGESGLPWEECSGRSRKVFDAEETMAASLPAIDFIIEGVEADFARLAVSAGRPKDEWKALFVAALFRAAFEGAGLPYFNPHSFRKTIALFGQEVCQTPEEFKAWSQNLGHESVMTTFSSYGKVNDRRQAEIIRSLGREKPSSDGDGNLVREIAKLVARHKGGATSVATA